MRPHTGRKKERDDLIVTWATLFHKYKVQLVQESDAHTVKITWPIRPSRDAGSAEGFIRDDDNGTIYMGEGGWGAPLRAADDPKPWTRSYGSFNQFKWLFIDSEKIEIRTVRTEGSSRVAEVNHNRIFETPYGLTLWNPKEGDVVRIMNDRTPTSPVAGSGGGTTAPASDAIPAQLDANGNLDVTYVLTELCQVQLILINTDSMQEMARLEFNNQPPGPHKKSIDLSRAPAGKYMLVVKNNGRLNKRYALRIE
ncbi:MAG: hypothetical protein R2795_04470 [Saprospiraceae bacterium]